MNGAESLVRTLVASGIDTCFANPGTSEMHFVGALDKVEGIRAVLGLFEGVVTGAADGYARMTGRPAATLLHLGPGLANGLANLHNARRAASPIVNVVGDHATYHAQYDPPLASDVAGFARPVSAWVHASLSPRTVAADAARAVQAARAAPGQIATLILPADTAWLDAEGPAAPLPVAPPPPPPAAAVDRAAQALKAGARAGILMRGAALTREALEDAGRIAAASGCRLFCDTFAPRLERGAGVVEVERIPYFAEAIVEFLKDLDTLVLVGAKPPTAFFAYPGKPSWCLPESCSLCYLAHDHEDGPAALAALAEAVKAPQHPVRRASLELPGAPSGKFNAHTIGLSIARHLPEGAVLSDDAATSSAPTLIAAASGRPHVHLALTGGSIGQGLPVAAGAATACPDRKVVCITGDGSGLYTPQALWTMGRERLDVTTVVFANRSYKILNVELGRVGVNTPGPKARAMLELRDPDLDWVSLAQGFGIEASRADTIEAFDAQFADAMEGRGPRLIEAVIG
ncbi:MAG TPA: acetolactate synthase large subunit [Phenylobacterium sp.]